jgi:hypothetical protein
MFNLESLLGFKYKILVDYFKKIIPKNIGKHKEVIQRISVSFHLEDDIVKFTSLINDVYAEGYSKAMVHCQEKLAERGIKFNIIDGNSNPQN